jgi:hypothetical protein
MALRMFQAVDISCIGVMEDCGGRLCPRSNLRSGSRTFQLQPFGGYLLDYGTFSGFRLPTRIEAGNHFETDHYFAFFKATVSDPRWSTRA